MEWNGTIPCGERLTISHGIHSMMISYMVTKLIPEMRKSASSKALSSNLEYFENLILSTKHTTTRRKDPH